MMALYPEWPAGGPRIAFGCVEWRWSDVHYQRTAQDWLENFVRHRDEIERVLRKVHGGQTALWMRRWRWCLLATAGLFGYAGGSEWGVSH